MCADEFLPVGQTTHRKKLVETSSSGTVAELVASWLQPSTESFGILGASTAMIGHVIADASTAKIGALQGSTEAIGHVIADASTAKIGALQASTESIGHIIADASTAKIGALQGSTEAIGQVGGHTAFSQFNVAVTTSGAYSTGDLIGGQISFTSVFRSTSVMTGIVQSLIVADKSTGAMAGFDIVFFQTATTGTTYTNDAAINIVDGDLNKIIGKLAVSSGDYRQFTDNSVAVYKGLGLPIQATTGTGITAAIMCLSTGPSYATTGDLAITIGVLQD